MQVENGVAILLLAATVACGVRESEKRIEAVKQDEEVLHKVTAAVNQVVRASTDCEAVKGSLPEARQKLNEAASQLKEEGSRRILDALRQQLDHVANACP